MSSATLASGAALPALVASRGRVGMLLLILSESAFFSIFIVAYLFYIGKSLTGPYPQDVLEFPLRGTLALLASSGTILLAVRALQRDRLARFAAALCATIALGLVFLGLTALEWHHLIWGAGLTLRTNLFGTTFYSLVGFHAAHVSAGVLMMALIGALAALGRVRPEHAERVEMVSWYWHFVDVVWIAVVGVVYVIGA